jgi:hypothetical protein
MTKRVLKIMFLFVVASLTIGFVLFDNSNTKQKGSGDLMPSQTPMFELISSKESGIYFNNEIKDDKEKNILLYANFYGGAGVGVGDFNNDGLEDVYFAGNLVDDELYLNLGDFKFENRTKSSGIINDGSWSTGVTVADINNDGLLDIYVTKELYDHKPNLRKNKLYINQGNAKFLERGEQYGVADSERSRHATFFDYDKDGFLDLFVLNQPPNPGSYSEFFGTQLLQPKYTSRLYKNINGKYFKDVTSASGLLKAGFPNGVSTSDLNNDGYVDIYVANDFYVPDFMYINNGDGTFTNSIDNALNHMSYYSMGVDVADINDDGFLDLFVVDMVAEDNFRLKSNMSGMNPKSFWNVVSNGGHYQYMFNSFQLNNGNQTFSEIAQLTNTAATDWSWSPLIADFDNDGKKDIYVTNGLLRDIRNTDASKAVGDFVIESANTWIKDNPNGGEVSIWDILDLDKTLAILPSAPISNYMYQNNGNLDFGKVAESWGLDQKSFSNGAAYADFDNDGDLDIIVNNINSEAFVYKNNSINNYLRIQLKSKNNKPTFGSKVVIKTNINQQTFETTNVRGIYSTSENVVHFGVGSLEEINEVIIHWPNKTMSVLKNVKSNQTLVVYLESGQNIKLEENNKLSQIFRDISAEGKIKYLHKENNFDDFEYQLLLPHKMSQFGPSLAIGDVNGDGRKDVFVGGAVGYPGQLFIQTLTGEFKPVSNKAFDFDKAMEDLDAILFDVDSDGDNDLFVVSGGNEYKKGDENYRDRLYLNDGLGNFSNSKKSLKTDSFSGSVAVPADFDNDGDLDVFVGGRHLPHEYPLPADSKLLENINGVLVDVTQAKAVDLNKIGMVTDAIWTDYDNDKDLDLMLVGEWMPIVVFENVNGTFLKQSLPSLKNTEGWWFSIEQGDFDHDGDMDYIAGNLGLNYKYKTSVENPFDVYYKDFDGNGSNDVVLGYYNYGKHYPLRGFSCSSQQIPSLKKDFKKYDIFASLEIKDIYGKDNLDEANHYYANTFATSFIENLGNKEFKISKLPINAQFSNVNDMVVEDFNSDGNLDVLLVGNLFVSEIETTRNDAGTGLVLLGDGKNKFRPLNYFESGFFCKNDAKKVKLLNDGSQKLLFVANNNNVLQVFKVTE